jgi:hypothetical protein
VADGWVMLPLAAEAGAVLDEENTDCADGA